MSKQLRFHGKTTRGDGMWQIHNAITGREDFHAGSMSGREVGDNDYPGAGRLEGEARDTFNRFVNDGRIVYVVYSYATPIAYQLVTGAWFVPDESYSATTSRHQGIVRVALRNETVYA